MRTVLKVLAWTLFGFFIVGIGVPFTYGVYLGLANTHVVQVVATPQKSCRDI